LLIVVLPLAVLTWLGTKVVRDEQAMVAHRFQQILLGRLRDIDGQMQQHLAVVQQQLADRIATLSWHDSETLRQWLRTEPFASQLLVLDTAGKRVHPPSAAPRSQQEDDFIIRLTSAAADIWAESSAPAETWSRVSRSQAQTGWHVRFWDNGLALLFWYRHPRHGLMVVELARTMLLASLIADLPDTPAVSSQQEGTIALADTTGRVAYQWGQTPIDTTTAPQALLPLSPPLNAWKLYYVLPATQLPFVKRQVFGLFLGLATLGVVLGGLAFYVYREHTRTLRDARQRVTFVNQVSHELKTPLTNIRMYAELLESQIDADDDTARRYVHVITSESQRLSRLINNVLMFARGQKHSLSRHDRLGTIDAVVHTVVETFTPVFAQKGIEVYCEGQASEVCLFDPDIVEQILANLFSNVEKYAAAGQILTIETRQEETRGVIRVADRGPGIAPQDRDNIFEAFYRANNSLTDGVSGTGIGLPLARELARVHGGDLSLVPADVGACFELVFALRRKVDA
jgi:signal transduction histidine kinase